MLPHQLYLYWGPSVEVIKLFAASPLAKRTSEFWTEFLDAYENLVGKVAGLDAAKLPDNPVFVSAVIQAQRIAQTTSDSDKRKILRNALLNIAVGDAPDEDIQTMFLQNIERFTPTHIKLFEFLSKPYHYLEGKIDEMQQAQGVGVLKGIELVFPHLGKRPEYVKSLLLDLFNSGLIISANVDQAQPGQTLTNLGAEFQRFIMVGPLDKSE